MDCANVIFPIILYILGALLLVTLIVLCFKVMQTLKKVNAVIDDVSMKSSKLDNMFNLIDSTTDAISNVSSTIVDFIVGAITGFFSRKDKRKVEDENEK